MNTVILRVKLKVFSKKEKERSKGIPSLSDIQIALTTLLFAIRQKIYQLDIKTFGIKFL